MAGVRGMRNLDGECSWLLFYEDEKEDADQIVQRRPLA
jgi:hypothetical protein